MTHKIRQEYASIVVLLDFENLTKSAKENNTHFDLHALLERVSERGSVLETRAYGDFAGPWYEYHRLALLEAGVRQVQLGRASAYNQKNRADIRLAIDAIEIAFRNPLINTFVIGSGDSDESELLIDLRAKGMKVIVAAYRDAVSEFVTRLADEFIDLTPGSNDPAALVVDPALMLSRALVAARSCGRTRISAASLKPLIQAEARSFNERSFGYPSFRAFLEAHPDLAPIRWEETPGGPAQLFVELMAPETQLAAA